MAGIYIHIPFCRRACHYCNFHFSTSLKLQNDFVAALLEEIRIRKQYLAGENVGTIYFGGGTPSLLLESQLQKIMQFINRSFAIDEDAEVTLEANPDDITTGKLNMWKSSGVNRLSIGIQSFFEEDLQWMNRAHNASQALDCIPLAHHAGFDNISADLIYGGPTLPDDHWVKNMQTMVDLKVPHLSCYALTVEPGTALDVMMRKKKVKAVVSEDQARQFGLMTEFLREKGYEHYEISNFAQPGKRSRHNSAYWTGARYLGLGPSAHSFNGVSRQWNVSNNSVYINSIVKDGNVPSEVEVLTIVQKFNEYIMTSLRTIDGVKLEKISHDFGADWLERLAKNSERHEKSGLIQASDDKIVLTEHGKLFADGIASDLFEIENRDHTNTASIFLNASRG